MKETKKWLAGTLACVSLGLIASVVWMQNEKISLTKEREIVEEQIKNKPNRTTEITYLGEPNDGYSLFRSASFQEKLLKAGIYLKYEELEPKERVKRFNNSKAFYVTTTNQFLADRHKLNGEIIAPISYSQGADAIVVNNKKCPLSSLKDLKRTDLSLACKGILYAKNTTSQDFFDLVLARFEELHLYRLDQRQVSSSQAAWENFRSPTNSAGVAILSQPEIENAIADGYQVTFSTADVPTSILSVVVASDTLKKENPKLVRQILKIYFREIDLWESDKAFLTQEITTNNPQLSSIQAQSVIDGTSFFTLDSANKFMSDGTIEKQLGATAAVLALNSQIGDVPTTWQSYYEPQFLRLVAQKNRELHNFIEANEPARQEKRDYFKTPTDPTITAISPKTEHGTLEVREKIQFQTDFAVIDPASSKAIDRIAEQIKQFDSDRISITIIGHTSRRGNATVNQTLSVKRATAVRKALIARGVTNSIVSLGKGSSQPLPGTRPQDNANQRTEIAIVSK